MKRINEVSLTTDQPTVSTITINYNSGSLLKRCINSVKEIPHINTHIIVDNASTDDSLPKDMSLHQKVICIKNDKNLGFSTANNQGIAASTSPYLMILNPDTTITHNASDILVEYLDTHPDVGMVGPLILNEDGSEQRGCRREEPTPLKTFKTLFGNREKGINQVGKPLPDGPVEVDAISGACMLVRREALEDVGLMDEGYFLHFEDLDWCKRFWLKGWKVMFVPDAVITHFKGGSSRSRPVRVEWHKHKGMVRYYRKFYSDQYPKPFLWAVYGAVWARFLLMTPLWWIKGIRT